MKKFLKYVLILMVLVIPFSVSAKTTTTKTTEAVKGNPINLYVFYGNGCPHCEDLLSYLSDLEEDTNYNYMFEVVKYEVWYDEDNSTLMQNVAEELGTTASGVPFYVVGSYYNSGFPDISSTDKSVKAVVQETTDELKSEIKKAYEAANAEQPTYTDIVAAVGSGNTTKSSSKEAESSTANDVIGYIILGITAIIIIAIIFGRSSSKDEDEEVEEAIEEEVAAEEKVEEEVKEVAKKVAVKKSTTKATAKKTTTTKKAGTAKKASTTKKASTAKKSTAKKTK